MKPLKLVLLTAAMLTAFAATAQAARYAAPGAEGPEPCAKNAPCSLEQAVKHVQAGGEVIVGSGNYPNSKAILSEGAPANIWIHGDFSGPPPLITSTATSWAIATNGNNSRIEYLEVAAVGKNTGGVDCYDGTVSRVRVTGVGEGVRGIVAIGNCTLRDSAAIVNGTNATAISADGGYIGATTTSVTNVTGIATGSGSRGLSALCSGCNVGATYKLSLFNSIVRGEGFDIEGFSNTQVTAANSSFETAQAPPGALIDAGGNQKAPPQFVNAAGGDYREAAGSPTIDAGTTSAQLGPVDLAGNPRTQGGAVDIGAYEFVPPAPPPPPVLGQVQSLSLSPSTFRTANIGEAIVSAKKKARAPVGTTVTYSLSVAAMTTFTVERKTTGRKAGKKCVKQTKANKGKAKCPLLKPVKGSFTHAGVTGSNSFKFSGRVGGKALAPGSYVLTGAAGGSSHTVGFRIVK